MVEKARGGDARGLEKINEIEDSQVREAIKELWLFELDETDQKKMYKDHYRSVISAAIRSGKDGSE